MGKYMPRVEKNHPNHFGQNKVGEPVKTCRYCQNIWDEKEFLLCNICKECKGRSKKFRSTHALSWHKTHYHSEVLSR